MANTKIPVELSSTPGIVDNSDATAITIGSNEKVGIGTNSTDHQLSVNAADYDGIQLLQGGTDTGYIGVYHDGSSTGRIYLGGLSSVDIQTGNGAVTDGTTRVRVDSDGLKFGTDTAADNALDDYEEGTFTPTIVSGATSVSYSTQAGHYTKIGNTMTVHMRVQPSSLTKQSSLVVFGGLPEACKLSTYGAGVVSYTSSFANENVNLYINPGSTQLSIYKRIGTSFVGNDLVSTAFDFRIMAVYLT